VIEANESQTSYSVEHADIFQYQSYSYPDNIFFPCNLFLKKNTSMEIEGVRFMVFYATFNNISVISWRSVF
jgi:hypothetical protein